LVSKEEIENFDNEYYSDSMKIINLLLSKKFSKQEMGELERLVNLQTVFYEEPIEQNINHNFKTDINMRRNREKK
jgi:hypothetical protein